MAGRRVASPQRTCVGCRRVRPAEELVRVVLDPDGRVVPGHPGTGGRGAWLCRDRPGCLAPALAGGLSRSFRRPVRREAGAALRAMMEGRGNIDVAARG